MILKTSQTEKCAPQVLLKEGFEKVFWKSKIEPFSHYDFQAEKNGEKYFIEVKDINYIFRSLSQIAFLKKLSEKGEKVSVLLIDKKAKKYIFISVDEYSELCEDKNRQIPFYFKATECSTKHIFIPNKRQKTFINKYGFIAISSSAIKYIGISKGEGVDYITHGKTILILPSNLSPEQALQYIDIIRQNLEDEIKEKEILKNMTQTNNRNDPQTIEITPIPEVTQK